MTRHIASAARIVIAGTVLLGTAAAAQRMPVDIGSDSTHGNMLRVYYSQTPDPVTIETTPDVHFVCSAGAITECYAYLKPTAKVTIRVWRKPAVRAVPALRGMPEIVQPAVSPKGIPASGHQWRESCVGAGTSCTVTMDAGRSVGVNWISEP